MDDVKTTGRETVERLVKLARRTEDLRERARKAKVANMNPSFVAHTKKEADDAEKNLNLLVDTIVDALDNGLKSREF